MFNSDQILLIRALNTTKQVYFPSYIGLRVLSSQLSKDDSGFLQRAIYRRLLAGDIWRYHPFKMYKGSKKDGEAISHEYRDCLAPSPFTAVAEAFLLNLFALNPAFSVPERAYSYRWPKSTKSGFGYEFYAEGYKQRNVDIGVALRQKDHVAVVTDIKSFYPSATFDMVKKALDTRFEKSANGHRAWREPVMQFYSQVFDRSSKGIPVGPSTSHMLGHLVLDEVDRKLTAKYGNNYFRYVDDVVVVCHNSSKAAVEYDIASCIAESGFSLNSDKTTIVGASEWHSSVVSDDVQGKDSFRSLIRDLTVYLAFHPERAEELNKIFVEGGFSIPVKRLKAQSSYSRFRYFLSRRKDQQGMSHALSVFFSNNNEFALRAFHLKEAYELQLKIYMGEVEYEAENTKRWKMQRVRRVINTLFYLRSFNEWYDDKEIFNTFPELVEQRALAASIRAGIINPVLPFYGRGPAAFAELWHEHGHGELKFSPSEKVDQVSIDGLATLRLHGLLAEESVSELYQDSGARLLASMSDTPRKSRSIPDLSFEDEFESLRLGITNKEISKFSHSKYSNSEGPVLSALSLLGSEYLS